MQKAKSFFYLSVGILALAIAFHLGAQSAEGQASSMVAGVAFNNGVNGAFNVVMENGDVYRFESEGPLNTHLRGNIFSGLPVTTTPTTLGRVKAERR